MVMAPTCFFFFRINYTMFRKNVRLSAKRDLHTDYRIHNHNAQRGIESQTYTDARTHTPPPDIHVSISKACAKSFPQLLLYLEMYI